MHILNSRYSLNSEIISVPPALVHEQMGDIRKRLLTMILCQRARCPIYTYPSTTYHKLMHLMDPVSLHALIIFQCVSVKLMKTPAGRLGLLPF